MGGTYKPLLDLAGEPLLAHTIRPFLEIDDIEQIVIALPEALALDPPPWLRALDSRIHLVSGGAERGDSVRRALATVPVAIDVVVVHDAARPLVTVDLIRRALAAAAEGRSVIAAVPVTDTIQQIDDAGRIVATPARSGLRAAQTPQAFPRAVLVDAYAQAAAAGIAATDDAALVARCGGVVEVIAGDAENIKVTTPVDLERAAALLLRRA